MATKPRRRGRKEDEHAFLCIEVTEYEVSTDAALNPGLRGGRLTLYRSNDLAYEFSTSLTINGNCVSPPERAGDTYHLTVTGKELRAGDFSLTLDDFQARDEDGLRQYRSYRGQKTPVYVTPPGIARMQRRRGANVWDVWFWFDPRLVSDMLCQLPCGKPLYVSLHEQKVGRDRWIQRFSLRTSTCDDE